MNNSVGEMVEQIRESFTRAMLEKGNQGEFVIRFDIDRVKPVNNGAFLGWFPYHKRQMIEVVSIMENKKDRKTIEKEIDAVIIQRGFDENECLWFMAYMDEA